jgi:branched-chain amino acid transport system permease protein
MKKTLRNGLALAAFSAVLLFGVTVLILKGAIDEYTAMIITLGSINVIIALSLNLISGFCGQLALGHAGFMAIGAYASAFTVMQLHLPLGLGVLLGGVVSALFGFMIGFPALRLRGDYLAIVTLGFGEIIRVIMINLPDLTGGAAGLKGIPPFVQDFLLRPAYSFFWTFLAVVLIVALVHNLLKSSWGRAIISVRDDEIAAQAMGINIFGYKMFAFTVSAFIAGIGGALYAPFFGYLNPTMFTFQKSVDFVTIVVLGGMGSVTGTIISGYVVTYLLEQLRFMKDYRLVAFPLMLIIIMLFRPGGLMGKKEISLASLASWISRRLRGKAREKAGN